MVPEEEEEDGQESLGSHRTDADSCERAGGGTGGWLQVANEELRFRLFKGVPRRTSNRVQ